MADGQFNGPHPEKTGGNNRQTAENSVGSVAALVNV